MSSQESNLRKDFIYKHLPYRLNVLMSHDILTHPCSKPILENEKIILERSLEASIVFGRLLMNFLGVTIEDKIDKKFKRYGKRNTDYDIQNLGYDYLDFNHPIFKQNENEIHTLIKYANKTVAHCTSIFPSNAEQDQFKTAKKAIYELVITHITEIDRSKLSWEKYK
ncbi:MAG: hypothetical protein ACI35V_07190 [Sphingobacterium composti]|uniref:hypothetical protein n=1 Tax=Sphingobacterium composti TaxID=363260 RepID=UPI00135973FD|nr:hypothetical protein [Sphingobacterium composti Ten et al. 2007 non Yoo et al. 2007]